MAAFFEESRVIRSGTPQALSLVRDVLSGRLILLPTPAAPVHSRVDVTMKATTGGVPAWRLIVLFFVTSFVISFANLPCQSVSLLSLSLRLLLLRLSIVSICICFSERTGAIISVSVNIFTFPPIGCLPANFLVLATPIRNNLIFIVSCEVNFNQRILAGSSFFSSFVHVH